MKRGVFKYLLMLVIRGRLRIGFRTVLLVRSTNFERNNFDLSMFSFCSEMELYSLRMCCSVDRLEVVVRLKMMRLLINII